MGWYIKRTILPKNISEAPNIFHVETKFTVHRTENILSDTGQISIK